MKKLVYNLKERIILTKRLKLRNLTFEKYFYIENCFNNWLYWFKGIPEGMEDMFEVYTDEHGNTLIRLKDGAKNITIGMCFL